MPMPAAEREQPRVPNHELVRVIGRGAYGEIWMARSLTGALRAIKIVDERTFENEKAFQREFEGMSRFEPISRSDAGFVDILHVGRDDGGHFFYYVMELADDVTGESVDPEQYIPKTLRTELGRRARLLVDECLSIGISLTRAVAVLHRQGLVHRDIKPANIIFVGGVPKIADIGLVAASGQNSFVGTEGYVPPEGPGSIQADLYSLGKVLYEIAMGKDRLDFPALHTDLTSLPEKDRLMQLNDLLLRACASNSRERYTTAEEMCEDLERIRDGQPLEHRRKKFLPAFAAVILLGAAGAGATLWQRNHQPGAVTITTEPADAMVILDGTMRRSPALFDHVMAGIHVARVMAPGFDPSEVRFAVGPSDEVRPPQVHLTRSHGVLQLASSPAGADFTVLQDTRSIAHGKCPLALDSLPTGEYDVVFSLDGREKKQHIEVKRDEPANASAEFASGQIAISSEPPGAEITVDGKRSGVTPLTLPLAEGSHEIIAHYRTWPDQRRTIESKREQPASAAFEFLNGTVKITSAPTGATVYLHGKEIGKAPLLLEDLPPGAVSYELRLPGYKPFYLNGEVKPNEQTFLGARLIQRAGPQAGRPWENSLGMKFVPVGDVLMCVWPARVRDYDAFCVATGRTRLPADFAQDPAHPVVRVNWDDATAFCDWLTQKELHASLLEPGQLYRLPTDAEWSQAVGLPPESGNTPEERDGKSRDFPWGKQWPPPVGAGNYADGSSKRKAPGIPGYKDGFAQTSPVGSFAPNRLGLFDMGGNVWQWVQDSYKGGKGKDWGVLRGGSWATSSQAELHSSYRNVVDRAERDVIFGFRAVLVPEPGT